MFQARPAAAESVATTATCQPHQAEIVRTKPTRHRLTTALLRTLKYATPAVNTSGSTAAVANRRMTIQSVRSAVVRIIGLSPLDHFGTQNVGPTTAPFPEDFAAT